jgi:hypothetical protein
MKGLARNLARIASLPILGCVKFDAGDHESDTAGDSVFRLRPSMVAADPSGARGAGAKSRSPDYSSPETSRSAPRGAEQN